MVLMIPMAYPVYCREMGSRMYSATAYFFSTTLSNVCINIFYPLLVTMLTFWFYGFPEHGFSAWLCFLAIETSGALAGIAFGQVIGSFVHSEYAAMSWLLQSLTIYYLGAGMLVNARTANWFG